MSQSDLCRDVSLTCLQGNPTLEGPYEVEDESYENAKTNGSLAPGWLPCRLPYSSSSGFTVTALR